ncbi:MAG: DUF1611 domain-containing protein [Halieaceae bacterium]|jgi:uncharacterized NAD-dependent epimerase/dehydratase family protein|nr:DUF1611 domain-containing protein [Halieaceae bacterium]
MQNVEIRAPYLLFVGDEARPTYAKTAQGLVDWRRECCAGQLRLSNSALDLGLPDMDIASACDAGVGSLLIGTALVGGSLPEAWIDSLCAAARTGIDVVAGLHAPLASIPSLVDAASAGGARLIDVRKAPAGLPVGTGRRRPGKRLLTVGTDCALGKKYTALALERYMRERGLKVDFRATGQTGIMIAGSGIPIDAVVADFISGAAEALSPANDDDHWDVIEGQGSLFHPGYAAVSHGLLLGSQPDAFVVCHAAGRTEIEGWPGFALPDIAELIERTLDLGRLTNPAIRCIGISVNTMNLAATQRDAYLAQVGERHGLPCVDPMLTGTGALIDELLRVAS